MELDDVFNDDVTAIQAAAAQMSQQAQSIRSGNPPKQVARQMPGSPPSAMLQANSAPPTAMPKTDEELAMERYEEEKAKLYHIYQQLYSLAMNDKAGEVIRNFGMSQLVIKVGDAIDRTNGLILLRALKSKDTQRTKSSDSKSKDVTSVSLSTSESTVTCLYEVWAKMDDGTIGLTACYDPTVVLFVVSLKSGYDMPPED